MSNIISDLANSAFNTNCNTNSNSKNYLLACELIERSCLLRDKSNQILPNNVDIMEDDDGDPDLVGVVEDVDDEDHVVDEEDLHNQYHRLNQQLNNYYNYGETLAKTGRLKETFDIYSHICNHMYYRDMVIPLDKLNCLVNAFIDKIIEKRTNFNLSNFNNNDIFDPLCCPICENILRYPVTSICGHTFCRQCCFGRNQCRICGQKFPKTQTTILSPLIFMNQTLQSPPISSPAPTITVGANMDAATTLSLPNISVYHMDDNTSATPMDATILGAEPTVPTTSKHNFYAPADILDSVDNVKCGFEQDILIRRLVEKWWSDEIKSSDFSEESLRHMEMKSFDAALRFSNQSLEYGEFAFYILLYIILPPHHLRFDKDSCMESAPERICTALKCTYNDVVDFTVYSAIIYVQRRRNSNKYK